MKAGEPLRVKREGSGTRKEEEKSGLAAVND